ncbi:MAG: hypothetical protein KDK70_37325 [Myxococcales bacterium]|nr:hypothetical protein [Myxococcales bacterium]
MAIRESELRERLSHDDDDVVEAALREHFEPRPHDTPLTYRWCLRDDVELEPEPPSSDADDSVLGWMGDQLLDLANGAQRLVRARRFARQRGRHPDWPVVVAEGDSWVAHPLLHDITDHLRDDDRYPYAVLGVGAAADLLRDMEAEHDHERAAIEHGARALLLSGGGNDLLESFGRFLRPWSPGSDPQRLLTDEVDARMATLMQTLRALLTRARARLPALPILVHGYDYLQTGEPGERGYLGPFFDDAGIVDPHDRRAALRAIVDRYNRHVAETAACVPDVTYVDLRGVVPESEWHDDIHPDDDGFARVTAVLAQRLEQRLGRG